MNIRTQGMLCLLPLHLLQARIVSGKNKNKIYNQIMNFKNSIVFRPKNMAPPPLIFKIGSLLMVVASDIHQNICTI